jgi:peptide deformylase
MIKPIMKDVFFLSQKSETATKNDLSVGQDLMDTLRANQAHCVGMAANMIGVKRRIIIVNMGIMNVLMYNPVIVKKDTPYETEEGLSIPVSVTPVSGTLETGIPENREPRFREQETGIPGMETTIILP